MKDWYFNAGIVGFLLTLTEGEDLSKLDSNKIIVKDNYIEILDDSIFEGFEEKFRKMVFNNLFKLDYFKYKVNNAKSIIEKEQEKKKSNFKESIKELKSSKDLTNFFEVMNFKYNSNNEEQFKKDLDLIISEVNKFNTENSYQKVVQRPKGEKYIKDYLNKKTKGLFTYGKINGYLKDLDKHSKQAKKKSQNLTSRCISCYDEYRKSSFLLDNSISNIIGFNKDNTNWVWKFNTNNIKLCSLCAIIYSCAFVSFALITKKIGKNYLNFLYFLNYNTSLTQLVEQIRLFKLNVKKQKDSVSNKPFYLMVKQTANIITQEQSKQIADNINFIEIAESSILGGQSTKSYDLYNYNIDYELAKFLNSKLEKLPKGYYKDNDTYFYVDEELLTDTITRRLSYQTLNKYLKIYISKLYTNTFKINFIIKYVFDFISYNKGEIMTDIKERIFKNGFRSGAELKNLLKKNNKSNQINGIAYRLLNDLKIADRDKFLDKYTRLMMGNDLTIRFGKNEMIETDHFLHFGYSFINGLLSSEREGTDKKQSNQEAKENK